ncbi:molybdenum cofactor biosynthesis MoaA domain protein [[Clostridium] sordellii ATCC 9714]|nr:molybdenum cofactor biosynthesis MoaA domain protein [[Clostridium] sordellii ATCC 9714] [Paeniclostridium sordellii ATCC 9714]
MCLHSNEEISIKEYLKDENKFLEFINKIIYNKPEKHNLIKNEKSDTKRNMYQIGG